MSWLFNGVHHIYNQINVTKNQEQELVGPGNQDNIVDVLNEVMDYESNDTLPNIDDHVFHDENEGNDTDEDEADMQNKYQIFLQYHVCWISLR